MLMFLLIALSGLGLAASRAAAGEMGCEASREFSGKPFLEMQSKAREVKLDFTIGAAKNAPLKISLPAKRKPLESVVKSLPDEVSDLEQEAHELRKKRFEIVSLGMDLAVSAIGVVFGALAGGLPGAVVGGTIAYGAWTAAKKTS